MDVEITTAFVTSSRTPMNTTFSGNKPEVYTHDPPLAGFPGKLFYILHFVAIASLSISIISSVTVFVIQRPRCPSFYQRTLGERLSVYLALGDLFFSVSHIIDHSAMLVLVDNPSNIPCRIMGFFVTMFMFVQICMVCFIGLNGFILVVKETKLSLGRYDWRFFAGTILFPFSLHVPLVALGINGPSGAWCFYDVRTQAGRLAGMTLSIIQISVTVIILISYVGIFIKIHRVSSATEAMGGTSGGADRYQVARVMMNFVAAYFIQYFALATYSLWAMFAVPPFELVLMVVSFTNCGGLFNLIVYTLLRRTGKKNQRPKSDSTNTSLTSVSK